MISMVERTCMNHPGRFNLCSVVRVGCVSGCDLVQTGKLSRIAPRSWRSNLNSLNGLPDAEGQSRLRGPKKLIQSLADGLASFRKEGFISLNPEKRGIGRYALCLK